MRSTLDQFLSQIVGLHHQYLLELHLQLEDVYSSLFCIQEQSFPSCRFVSAEGKEK